jgi:hypothetical protein
MKESSWKIKEFKECPQTSIQLKVHDYPYEHDLATEKDEGDEKRNPKNFAIKGIIPSEENHWQNTQPEKAKGIDYNQKPSCKMNPQGHKLIDHRICRGYSTSIRKGCVEIASHLEYPHAFGQKS